MADAHFVKLRGLPYQANEQQIAGFFQPLQVVAVQIAFNASGQPSGFGFVQFRTPDDASAALQRSPPASRRGLRSARASPATDFASASSAAAARG